MRRAGRRRVPGSAKTLDGGYVPGTTSRADGSFRIEGLASKPYVLAAGSPLAGFAIRGGVTPGEEPVTLTLRPGGRIAVRVLGADSRPVKEAYPSVETVDGLRVEMPGNSSGPTDATGLYELVSPTGTVGVVAATRSGPAAARWRLGRAERCRSRSSCRRMRRRLHDMAPPESPRAVNKHPCH